MLIDRPDKRNAFNQAMWAAFPGLVDTAMADPAVRLLIVLAIRRGVGPTARASARRR